MSEIPDKKNLYKLGAFQWLEEGKFLFTDNAQNKAHKDLTPTFFSEIFSKQSVQYNLRHASEFTVQTWKALFMIKSFSYQRPKIWDLVPKELKELSSSSAFENAIKKWKTQNWM